MNKSPFPGMDPFLEGEMWQEFHERLANQISEQLMPHLQPKYVALLNKRYVINLGGLGIVDTPPKRIIYPDAHIATVKETAIAYKSVSAPITELITPVPEKIPLLNIEIRDVAERRLVTAIEIFSPVNKRGRGFEEYVGKRTDLFQTTTHLLEIDLLRAGERIPLIGGELPPAPYYIFLSRFTRRPYTEVWPAQLREPLPTVPVPLLPPDEDVPLALQPAIEACFKLVGYQRLLDYSQLPPPPLSRKDALWVEQVTTMNDEEPVLSLPKE